MNKGCVYIFGLGFQIDDIIPGCYRKTGIIHPPVALMHKKPPKHTIVQVGIDFEVSLAIKQNYLLDKLNNNISGIVLNN